MRALAVALLACCCAGSAAAENLFLQLASRPVSANTLASRAEPLGLLVASGEVVHFTRAEGRDTRLRAGSGLTWAQVEEVPRNVESVTVQPTLQADGSIAVRIDRLQRQESRLRQFSSTLRAQPGEWLQLYGPVDTAPRDTRVYSTPPATGESLFLRVEPR